jgi:hypothetical protein
MKKLSVLAMSAFLLAAAGAVGCGDDDDNPSGTSGGGGTDAEGGGGGTTNNGGKSGSAGTAGSLNLGGDDPVGAAGMGGGGGGNEVCDVYAERPRESIPADADGNIMPGTVLTADTIWSLDKRLFVTEGDTLTIEPCTLIEGSPAPNAGSLFVMQGAKIDAVGTADAPIVFSSEDHALSDTPWGGVVLLGNAPIAPAEGDDGTPVRIYEGMDDDRAAYGGATENDDSGTMAYVRIEFGGDIIVTDPDPKEINGLSFAGVGSGTKIDHVMVKDQADDCFEWFGGTVNATHLICQNSGDDMFDTDEGFKGQLQYIFGRNLIEGTSNDPNGLEWDGNQKLLTAPVGTLGTPQASNVTICGFAESTKVSYGALLRRSIGAGTLVQNAIVTGWNYGVDTRDNVGTDAAPIPAWTNSLFFGQTEDDAGNLADDNAKDGAFNEDAWIKAEANANVVSGDAPAGFDCYAGVPTAPTAVVEGAEGFDGEGAFIGAFGEDNWADGLWVNWE